MPDKQQPSDLDVKALDALNSLGYGHWESQAIIEKHSAIQVLAAEERLRRTEQEKDIAAPRKYFEGILNATKKPGGKSATAIIHNLYPQWAVSSDARTLMHLEQCQGCADAAGLMPSFLVATERLAVAQANHKPGDPPIDPSLKHTVDGFDAAICEKIARHKGEPWPPKQPKGVSVGESGAVTFAPTRKNERDFEAERQRQLAAARKATPEPFEVVTPVAAQEAPDW